MRPTRKLPEHNDWSIQAWDFVKPILDGPFDRMIKRLIVARIKDYKPLSIQFEHWESWLKELVNEAQLKGRNE